MNILATTYTLQNKSLDIYVAGCNGFPHCTNCHNPESWEFNQGEKYTKKYFDKIQNKVKSFDNLIDNIMIFGGEPLDQDHDKLIQFLFDLNTLNKKVWLFTRYEIDKVPNYIKAFCDYIKTGRYIPEFNSENNIQFGIQLASVNQQIHKVR